MMEKENLNEENAIQNETTQTEEVVAEKPVKATQGQLRETLNKYQEELKLAKEADSKKDAEIQSLRAQLAEDKSNNNNQAQTFTSDEVQRMIDERIKPLERGLESFQSKARQEKIDKAIQHLYTEGATQEMVKEALEKDSSLANKPEQLVGAVLLNEENIAKMKSLRAASSNTDSVSINTEQSVDTSGAANEKELDNYTTEVKNLLDVY